MSDSSADDGSNGNVDSNHAAYINPDTITTESMLDSNNNNMHDDVVDQSTPSSPDGYPPGDESAITLAEVAVTTAADPVQVQSSISSTNSEGLITWYLWYMY